MSHDELEIEDELIGHILNGRTLEFSAALHRYYVPKAEYDRKVEELELALEEARGERELLSDEE